MGSPETLFERELVASRTREADYRARLTRHRELASKLRAHAARLRETVRAPQGAGRVETLLADVARLTSSALEIPRTSIWLFDATGAFLTCRFQLPPPADGASEAPLEVAACPGYVRAIVRADVGAIAVEDALSDARTAELRPYLERHRIGALLDVPLIGPGELRGVLCHEHQGGPRVWHDEEIDFAADVGALVALTLEVERRVRAEQTLRGTEAKYQHLVESLPVAVYSFDARSGALDYLSPRVEELGGHRAEEYLVSGGIERWVEAIAPEDRDAVRRRLSSNIEEGFEGELVYRISLPDGARRYVRDTCAVVRDARGRPVAVQGTLADITSQREGELKRAELERRFQTLLESVELLAVVLDTTGHVELINESFLKLTGYSREEALGADGFELMLPPHERTKVRRDYLEGMQLGKVVRRFETSIRQRDGALRRVLWTNTPTYSTDGVVTGSASLGVDITDRLEAEAIALQGEKLESLGRLAAGIAHDFNNLLTIIASGADRLALGRSDQRSAANDVQLAVGQAVGLTRALLAYARREPIRPIELAVDSLVEETFPVLAKLVPEGLSLTRELAASEARIMMDPTQLRQILMNLVANAADAAGGHGSAIRISTELVVLEPDQVRLQGLTQAGTFVLLSVADDGPGIPDAIRQRVFEPFFTTKGEGEGTGLGLAMCASMARRADGFVTAESAPGAGATLRVYLPLSRRSRRPDAPRAE